MPKNRFQQFMFAAITVFITVHCFVFFCLAIENGGMSIDVIKQAYSIKTWIFPIPLVLIEFILALTFEVLIGSPLSMKLAFKVVNPKCDRPFIVETAIICSTVCIMCPLMSFIATILYKLIPEIMFHTCPISTAVLEFIPQFLQTFVINFPFALLGQLFFIQPLVRKIFSIIFKNN